nr:uncharacterized protein LOC124815122 [Hydra vulgaris]
MNEYQHNEKACYKGYEKKMLLPEAQQDGSKVLSKSLVKHKTYRCPVEGCFKEVVNLSRHLQSKRHNHCWSKESAQKALSYFNKRKRSSDVETLFQCPYKMCMAIVKRIDNHLKRVHKFKSTDPDYAKMLYSVQKINLNNMPSNVISSPKKIFKSTIISDMENKNTSYNAVHLNIFCKDNSGDNNALRIDLNNGNIDSLPPKKIALVDNNNSCKEVTQGPLAGLDAPLNTFSDSESSTLEFDDESDDSFVPEDNFLNQLNINVETLLEKFKNFLLGPDNKREPSSAYRTVKDIQRYFQLVSTEQFFNVSKFFNLETIRDKYIKNLESKHLKAGSIKKYLFSLIDFSTFLLSEKEALKLSDCKESDVVEIKLKLNMWRKTYNREDRKEFWHRQERDYQSLVTPSQISSYLESDNAVQACNLFNFLCTNEKVITQAEYIVTRDHLILQILIGSAHRSGVCANMTIDEFLNHEVNADGMFIIAVAKHKTFSKYGHAYIILQAEKFQWLFTFVNKIRSQICTKYRNVFVSWSGQPMSSGAISQQLGSLWKKSGIYQSNSGKRNVCATLLRKSASTGVREKNIGNKEEIAGFMGHSGATADKHYHCRKIKNSAVESSSSIRSYFEYDHTDTNVKKYSNMSLKNLDTTINMSPPNKRKKWTIDEENILKNTFHKVPTMKDIIDVMPSIGINTTPKKLYDKARSLRGSPAAKTNVTPKRQKMFSKEDILAIHSCCGDLLCGGPLTQEKIEDVIKDSPLLKIYDWRQLRTRIVYERKKLLIKSKENDGNSSKDIENDFTTRKD